MRSELAPKAALHKAIHWLQRLFLDGAGASLIPLDCPPHARLAVRFTLEAAVAWQQPTVFVSESLTPDRAALHLLSLHGSTPLEAVVAHQIEENDFTRLVEAADQLASSPLFLLAHNPAHSEVTAEELARFTRAGGLKVVVSERRRAADLASWRSTLTALSKARGVRVLLLAGHPEAKPAAPRQFPRTA